MRKHSALTVSFCLLCCIAHSQNPASPPGQAAPPPEESGYSKPTTQVRLHNYFFDAFGPYAIVGAAFAAGINQAENTPPEWKQGAAAYGKRFGSNFGIAAVTTTTRYALAEALRDDTLYYPCDCRAFLPRLRHAVISTVTARRGEDGHTVFSIPAVVAPYVGTMTAVYGWYPDRYNAKDAFRMGNYTLLGYVGENVAIEFLFSGPHSLLSKMHIRMRTGQKQPAAATTGP